MRFIIILAFAIQLLLPSLTVASNIDYQTLVPIKSGNTTYVDDKIKINNDKDFSDYLNGMYALGIALCGGLAVLMIVIGGIEYISSDSVGKKTEGKERINAALLGLLVALGSYVILKTVDPRLLSTELKLEEVEVKAIPAHGAGSGTGGFTDSVPGGYVPGTTGTNVPPCDNLDQTSGTSGKGTFYYAASEEDYTGAPTAAFKDANGNSLAGASPQFLAAAQIEGTAKLKDGRVLNYASGSGNNIKWKVSTTAYGEGSNGAPLVPYHTVAADPKYYKAGQKLYVKELDGVKLPDGTTHNGFVQVGDVGSAIKGEGRFDIFTGAGKSSAGGINNITDRPITSVKCQ